MSASKVSGEESGDGVQATTLTVFGDRLILTRYKFN